MCVQLFFHLQYGETHDLRSQWQKVTSSYLQFIMVEGPRSY